MIILRRPRAIEEDGSDLGNADVGTNALHLRAYDTLVEIAPFFQTPESHPCGNARGPPANPYARIDSTAYFTLCVDSEQEKQSLRPTKPRFRATLFWRVRQAKLEGKDHRRASLNQCQGAASDQFFPSTTYVSGTDTRQIPQCTPTLSQIARGSRRSAGETLEMTSKLDDERR